jgi:hypothetical protein
MATQPLLVWPSLEYLPGYKAALERGWSADNTRGKLASHDELARIGCRTGCVPGR